LAVVFGFHEGIGPAGWVCLIVVNESGEFQPVGLSVAACYIDRIRCLDDATMLGVIDDIGQISVILVVDQFLETNTHFAGGNSAELCADKRAWVVVGLPCENSVPARSRSHAPGCPRGCAGFDGMPRSCASANFLLLANSWRALRSAPKISSNRTGLVITVVQHLTQNSLAFLHNGNERRSAGRQWN
jgi:hypothetical protein